MTRGDLMLLQEKMKTTKFSPSEQTVIDFILKKQELIEPYTTIMIAGETYTSPSVLIRTSKKLGFNGFNEFKKAFLKEVNYLKTSFSDLDANKPFAATDSIMNIAHIITKLKQESLNDTLSLIHHDSLQKAIRIMEKADVIKVFAIANLTFQAEELVYKLRRIGKKAETYSISNMMIQEATMTSSNDCAICISYSGESEELLYTTNILKQNQVPIIVISSVGENSLTCLGDTVLQITTRERAFSKIGAFASLESISLILDILYSCYFKTNYDHFYAFKTDLAKVTEKRIIDNNIIKEENE